MKNKIFWAFNAFDDELQTDIFVAEMLASLNTKLNSEVYPVFALGSEVLDSAPAFAGDTLVTMASVVETRMKIIRDKVTIPGLQKPQFIIEPSFSKSAIVQGFINHAEKNGANLIVVGSHGKKGLERAALGSFAETLLLQCHLPVLVVGQKFNQIPNWEKILFPTDFSDDSSYAFHKALELAQVLGSKVTLFHHLSPIIDPIFQSAMAPFGGVWMPYREKMHALQERKQNLLDSWAKKARENNVEIQTFLDTGNTDTAETIRTYSRKHNIGLITMGTQSGTIATAIFGAITRNVVRQAECPVWLLRRH